MSDCEVCQGILDEAQPVAAKPDVVEFVSAHVSGCEACRAYAVRLEAAKPSSDPEQRQRTLEGLRRRIRLELAGGAVGVAVMFAMGSWMVVEAVRRAEVMPWSALAGYLMWLVIDSLREHRMRRRNAEQFMRREDLDELCREAMDINRGLNATFGLIHFGLAILATLMASFVWTSRGMLAVAVVAWLLVAYNALRVFVLPKPWNGLLP